MVSINQYLCFCLTSWISPFKLIEIKENLNKKKITKLGNYFHYRKNSVKLNPYYYWYFIRFTFNLYIIFLLDWTLLDNKIFNVLRTAVHTLGQNQLCWIFCIFVFYFKCTEVFYIMDKPAAANKKHKAVLNYYNDSTLI